MNKVLLAVLLVIMLGTGCSSRTTQAVEKKPLPQAEEKPIMDLEDDAEVYWDEIKKQAENMEEEREDDTAAIEEEKQDKQAESMEEEREDNTAAIGEEKQDKQAEEDILPEEKSLKAEEKAEAIEVTKEQREQDLYQNETGKKNNFLIPMVDKNLVPIDEEAPEAPKQPTENNSAVGYNDRKSWWFKRNSDHLPPSAQQDIAISMYDGHYLGDTSRKVIYLTFDEGYENGYSEKILDILKEKQVRAAFFVTKTYIEANTELIKRMVAEGHIVGNHSVTHRDFTTLSEEEIAEELSECAKAFYEVTGTEMPPFFRPPEGVYSIRSLEATQKAGYHTIFWSYAYQDWDVNNQPGRDGAYQMAMDNYHNGALMLLHAVSQSNTEALADLIDSYREKGYTFLTLYDLL